MNTLNLVGRLTKDLEDLRYTNNNKAVLIIPLATVEKEATFLDVVVFGTTAENCHKYLSKGSTISLNATVKNNNYEKDGKKYYGYKFIGNNVTFISTGRKEVNEYQDLHTTTKTESIEYADSDLPF